MKKLRILATFIIGLWCNLTASAHDFKSWGVYYKVTSSTNLTVAVTYKGDSYDDYANEYWGSVTIPSTVTDGGKTYRVTSIEAYAFYGCSNLSTITIPEGVTSIESYAFYGCSNLSTITIPESVTSIGSYAFKSCSGLTSFSISKNVASIGNHTFAGCKGLTSIIVAESNDIYDSRENCNAIIETSSNTLVAGCSTTIIPNSVINIGSAFFDCNFDSFTIPGGVKSIDASAFLFCNFTSFTIAEGVTSISSEAFYDCTFTSITLPKSIKSIGKEAFGRCEGKLIINCEIPGCSDQYESAFYKSEFSKIVIGEGVTKIGSCAFSECRNLTAITIPESVTSIGSCAFDLCYGISEVHISDIAAWCNIIFSDPSANPLLHGRKLYVNGEYVTELTIPNTVKTITRYAFYHCSISSITIPSSVTTIQNYAFQRCYSLKEVVFEDGESQLNLGYNEYNAIIGEIGKGQFNDCPLESVYIGRNLSYQPSKKYGYSPFYGNTKLTTIVMGKDITRIGDYAFYGCSSLTSITLPESVTRIGGYAFSGCSSLTAITIPESVTSIGDNAFYNCSNLKTMVVKNVVPPALSYSLGVSTMKVVVPGNSVEAYREADYWEKHNIVGLYTITYLVDGETYEIVEVAHGDDITPIANPVKEGYTFGGWGEMPATMPAENIIVSGGYIYTVTYMVDGEIYETVKVACGDVPTLPMKEGYSFSSNEMPVAMPAEDIVVNGIFTANNYDLIYKVDDAVYKTEQVVYGSDIVLTDDVPTKEGHTFVEWVMPVSSGIEIASNADAMLYSNAPCTETRYGDQFVGWHVLFDNDVNTFFHSDYSGDDSADGLDHYLRVDMGEDNPISRFIFTYTVRGDQTPWYTPVEMIVEGSNEADGEYDEIAVLTELPRDKGEVYESDILGNGNAYRYIRYRVTETMYNSMYHGHPYFYFAEFGMSRVDDISVVTTMPAHDVVVNALLTKNKYKVTFKVGDEVLSEEMLEYGSRIIAPRPYKEGYTFGGWGDVAETVPAHDVTYEGCYSVNSYILTYIVDGDVVKEVPVLYGTAITSLDNPAKEGYTFSLSGEMPETMPAEDVTVYGTFTINKYRVTFALGGVVKKTEQLEYGATIVVPTFTEREGYTLTWSEEIPATVPAKDVYYNAVYVANIYQVYYFVGTDLVHVADVPYGEKIPEYIYEPEEGEEVFLGWLGDEYETMPAHEIFLTAEMVPVGIEKLIGNGEQKTVIYDLQGRRVLDTQNLKAGIYIVNGKKVVLK